MLTALYIIIATIATPYLIAIMYGIIKAFTLTPEERQELMDDIRMEKQQKKTRRQLYKRAEHDAYAKYPGPHNYTKRQKYINKHT